MTVLARDITSAIASGDTAAFAEFYREWFDFVLAEARHVSRLDEPSCLDIVQEVMMRVIRSKPTMECETEVRRWLSVVVKSCCYDELRRRDRRRRREQTISTERSGDDADAQIDEQLKWLRDQLRHLGRHDAELLSMRFRFGWTLERIGRFIGLKPGAVDGRISRALTALRQRGMERFDE